MKFCHRMLFMIALILTVLSTVAAQSPKPDSVPKYSPAAETRFKGTVQEVIDRTCPVSGGLGSHVMLKLADGKIIEVHLAATKFVQSNQLLLRKGDQIEVVGNRLNFQGADTIFAREVTRGSETFVFRDKEGNPVW